MSLQTAPPPAERTEEILSDGALAFVESLHSRFGQRRSELLAAREQRGKPAEFSRGDAGDPRGRLAGRTGARGLRRPPGGDHRPDRPQARHQRAQLGRQGLHGRLRGRQLTDLAQPGRGPRQPDRRDRGHDHLRRRRRPPLRARREPGHAARAPARLASAREARQGRRRAGGRRAWSTSACSPSTAPSACTSAIRGSTSTCPSSSTISRRGSGTTCSPSPRTNSEFRAGRCARPC